jgi:hypothetical protein
MLIGQDFTQQDLISKIKSKEPLKYSISLPIFIKDTSIMISEKIIQIRYIFFNSLNQLMNFKTL